MNHNSSLIIKLRRGFLIITIANCHGSLAFVSGKQIDNPLLDFSIDELMEVEVTTVFRRSEKVTQAASAVFVITQDDIRRSGATVCLRQAHVCRVLQ